MTFITKLYAELWFEIMLYLDLSSLKSLRLAFKAVQNIAASLLFRSLIVEFRRPSSSLADTRTAESVTKFKRHRAFLKAIVHGHTLVGQYVSYLSVSTYYPPLEGQAGSKLHRAWKHLIKPEEWLYEPSLTMLLDVLTKLPALVEFRYSNLSLIFPSHADDSPPHYSYTMTTQELASLRRIVEALPPRVTRLHLHKINLPPESIPSCSLSSFRNLESLSLSGVIHTKSLPHPIAPNPDLASLEIANFSVYDILIRLECTALRTLHLVKTYTFPESDVPRVLAYLQNLTCIELVSVTVPDLFWTSLQRRRICCTSVSLCDMTVSSAFVDYIASYSTLRHLTLDGIEDWHGHAPGGVMAASGTRFWRSVVELHAQSLQSLCVVPAAFHSAWCMDHGGLFALMVCKRMEHLNVAVAWAPAFMRGEQNILKLLPRLLAENTWPFMASVTVSRAVRTEREARTSAVLTEASLKDMLDERVSRWKVIQDVYLEDRVDLKALNCGM